MLEKSAVETYKGRGPEDYMRPKVWSRRDGTTPGRMRLLCGMMLSTLALSGAVASEPTIEVKGNRRVDAQAIRQHFHASPDGPSPAAIDAALKELYATGLFEDVKITRCGPRVIVTVVEAPLIERLSFEGNKQVKDKDLANEITLKPRGAMTKAAVREDVARIVEIYRRNGRYQVEVTPTTIPRVDGRVDLVSRSGKAPRRVSSTSPSSATANSANRA
jgi:outer membrane protein insertion porin family